MILSDNETKVDLLNNEAIAKTIITLLRERPDNPVTIGVHGDWGAGKSSILEMIEATLDDDKKVLCIKFNGWRFQGFEDAKIALIEGIVTGLIEKRPALTKASSAVKETFKRINWLKVARKLGGLALTATTGIPDPDLIAPVISAMKGWMANPSELVTKENIGLVTTELSGLIEAKESKHVPEEIQEFRKAFDDLLKEAKIDQLIVLVDDLDRCLPDTAIETLEAIRLFVFTERTAFVVAADEAMIEYAVRKHFPELPETTGPRDYARNYLEKLIQIPFRIPALGETETRIYVALLLIGDSLGDDDKDFQKLISVARERLKRPWAATAIDAAALHKTLGTKAEQVLPAHALSDQIGPILASGSKGNPRQIKRFLNTMVLRMQIANARGFGDDIKLPVLAKLMLAERFFPTFFEQIAAIAATSTDGTCSELSELEAKDEKAQELKKPRPGSKATAVKTSSSFTNDWIESEPVMNWVALEPALADVDLRPYLFVAKDKKDYFGSTSALGKLSAVADELMQPRIMIQGKQAQLRALAAPEAEQVFEEVRSRIMRKATFDTQPAGIDGLIALVGAHPNLENNLINFIEALPFEKLGAWAVSGWGSVIKSEAPKGRLSLQMEKWAASDNQMLKIAAGSTLKTPKKSR